MIYIVLGRLGDFVLAATMIVSVYFLIRNEWVYHYLKHIIKEDEDRFPSYERMVFRHPFCWNFDKFKK